MDMYVKVLELDYNWQDSQRIVHYSTQVKSQMGHTIEIADDLVVGSLDTPTSIHNAIMTACEAILESTYGITIGALDKRFLYGVNFTGLLS